MEKLLSTETVKYKSQDVNNEDDKDSNDKDSDEEDQEPFYFYGCVGCKNISKDTFMCTNTFPRAWPLRSLCHKL